MRKAFTLLELIMVVGILMIMTGLSASFYSRFLLQNAVDNTVSQITEDLRKAQVYSMTQKTGSAWGVKFGDQKVTLYQVGGSHTENFAINPNINMSGLADIQFNKITGTPSATGIIRIFASSINMTRDITLNNMGVASR